MKKVILKNGFIAVVLISTLFAVQANECRDVKLECKEQKKADGDYSPADRSICRTEKLLCKMEEDML